MALSQYAFWRKQEVCDDKEEKESRERAVFMPFLKACARTWKLYQKDMSSCRCICTI
jgi:hypothetical protein